MCIQGIPLKMWMINDAIDGKRIFTNAIRKKVAEHNWAFNCILRDFHFRFIFPPLFLKRQKSDGEKVNA